MLYARGSNPEIAGSQRAAGTRPRDAPSDVLLSGSFPSGAKYMGVTERTSPLRKLAVVEVLGRRRLVVMSLTRDAVGACGPAVLRNANGSGRPLRMCAPSTRKERDIALKYIL